MEVMDEKETVKPEEKVRGFLDTPEEIVKLICQKLFHIDVVKLSQTCKDMQMVVSRCKENYAESFNMVQVPNLRPANYPRFAGMHNQLPVRQIDVHLAGYEIKRFSLQRLCSTITNEDLNQMERARLSKVRTLEIAVAFASQPSFNERREYWCAVDRQRLQDYEDVKKNPKLKVILPSRMDKMCRLVGLIGEWEVESVIIKMGTNPELANMLIVNHPEKITEIQNECVSLHHSWVFLIPTLNNLKIVQLMYVEPDISIVYNTLFKKWLFEDWQFPVWRASHANVDGIRHWFEGIEADKMELFDNGKMVLLRRQNKVLRIRNERGLDFDLVPGMPNFDPTENSIEIEEFEKKMLL